MLKMGLAQGAAARLAALSLGIVLAGAQNGIAQTDAAPSQGNAAPAGVRQNPARPQDTAQEPATPEPSLANPAEPGSASGQAKPPEPDSGSDEQAGITVGAFTGGSAEEMLHVPVSRLHPGTVPINPGI
jgi:hypothetical protein